MIHIEVGIDVGNDQVGFQPQFHDSVRQISHRIRVELLIRETQEDRRLLKAQNLAGCHRILAIVFDNTADSERTVRHDDHVDVPLLLDKSLNQPARPERLVVGVCNQDQSVSHCGL